MECAFTLPVIIELGMLVMYCMQFFVSVSVVSMVSWCGVSLCYVYVGYCDVLEVFCVYFEKAATLFVFSVCAGGSEVWYLWCPGCGGEF